MLPSSRRQTGSKQSQAVCDPDFSCLTEDAKPDMSLAGVHATRNNTSSLAKANPSSPNGWQRVQEDLSTDAVRPENNCNSFR